MSRDSARANSIQSKLQLTDTDDASHSISSMLASRRTGPPPKFPDSKLPARVAPSERDEQLVELSRILNDCYASSGYFLAAVANGQSNFDVDRWSDRFRLQDASRRKQLFDEGSLSLRDFPPELGEMADRHTKRRRRLVEVQQKFARSTNMRTASSTGASVSGGVKEEEKTVEQRMRQLEQSEEKGRDADEDDASADANDRPDDGLDEFEIDNFDEFEDPEYGEDDYASNYFDDGDDDGDGGAWGKDDGPTMD